MSQHTEVARICADKVTARSSVHAGDIRRKEVWSYSYAFPPSNMLTKPESAYYRDASSTDSLLSNRTPLFAIHAEDDPVCDDLTSALRAITDAFLGRRR